MSDSPLLLDVWVDLNNDANPLMRVDGDSITELQALSLVAGDSVQVRVYLRRRSGSALTAHELTAGQSMVLAGRPKKGSGTLFTATGFEESGTGDVLCYVADLDLNGAAASYLANAAIGESVGVRCDLEIQSPENAYRRTLQFDAKVWPQVYAGGDPPEASDPPYPESGDIVIKLRGTEELAEDAVAHVVTGLGLSEAPAQVLLTLRVPSADDPLIAVGVLGEPSADGFTAVFGAALPNDNYKLDYLLVMP